MGSTNPEVELDIMKALIRARRRGKNAHQVAPSGYLLEHCFTWCEKFRMSTETYREASMLGLRSQALIITGVASRINVAFPCQGRLVIIYPDQIPDWFNLTTSSYLVGPNGEQLTKISTATEYTSVMELRVYIREDGLPYIVRRALDKGFGPDGLDQALRMIAPRS